MDMYQKRKMRQEKKNNNQGNQPYVQETHLVW